MGVKIEMGIGIAFYGLFDKIIRLLGCQNAQSIRQQYPFDGLLGQKIEILKNILRG